MRVPCIQIALSSSQIEIPPFALRVVAVPPHSIAVAVPRSFVGSNLHTQSFRRSRRPCAVLSSLAKLAKTSSSHRGRRWSLQSRIRPCVVPSRSKVEFRPHLLSSPQQPRSRPRGEEKAPVSSPPSQTRSKRRVGIKALLKLRDFWPKGSSGEIIQILETKSPVTSAEVSQDGRYITTADGSTVKFWDANHFGLVKSYNMPCTVESASLEPKFGNIFVAGGEDMWVRIFDFHTGEEISCNKGHHGPVHCVRFSPGGESYASGSEDGTVRIWQTGPLTFDDNESSAAVEVSGKSTVLVNDVASKVESCHISSDGKAEKGGATAES